MSSRDNLMEIEMNMIYGNPSYEHITAVRDSLLVEEWKATGHLDLLCQVPYPCMATSRLELLALVPVVNNVSPERLEHNLVVDEYLSEVWAAYARSYGVSVTGELLDAWVLPYTPIITYLKMQYNRPRPFQLAGVYNIPLYPRVKVGSTESSYPNGHVLQSCWIAHKLSLLHPELSSDWWHFVLDIKAGREELGVHYVSDGLFALQIYQALKDLWKI